MEQGRPRKYNTPEEMEQAIEQYFNDCQPTVLKDEEGNVLTDKKGTPIWQLNPPTITGLALALGFISRQSIYDYENRDEAGFSYIIKRARLRCENYVETTLLRGEIAPAGPIFILKNYGWSDQIDVNQSGEIKIVIDEVDRNL